MELMTKKGPSKSDLKAINIPFALSYEKSIKDTVDEIMVQQEEQHMVLLLYDMGNGRWSLVPDGPGALWDESCVFVL